MHQDSYLESNPELTYLGPVDTPNQVRACDERLELPWCRRIRALWNGNWIKSRNYGFNEVRPEAALIESGGHEMSEGNGGDLAFFLDGVHVHAQAKLIVPKPSEEKAKKLKVW
jgi:hypothetical protein